MTITIDNAIEAQREFDIMKSRETYLDSQLEKAYNSLKLLPDNAYNEMISLSNTILHFQKMKGELYWDIRNSTCPKTGKKHNWRRDVLQDPRDPSRSCNDPQYLYCDDCHNQYFLSIL